jgi:hypothetical protein
LDLLNPFDESISLTEIHGTVSLRGRTIGAIDEKLTENRWITVGPKQAKRTEKLYLSLKINLVALNALLTAATGQLTVDVRAVISCRVGTYACQLNYSQDYVPVELA